LKLAVPSAAMVVLDRQAVFQLGAAAADRQALLQGGSAGERQAAGVNIGVRIQYGTGGSAHRLIDFDGAVFILLHPRQNYDRVGRLRLGGGDIQLRLHQHAPEGSLCAFLDFVRAGITVC
jgi:hypothetical protein